MDKENIFINDKVYYLTPGLKNLIYFKKPIIEQCTVGDISNYVEIAKESYLLHRDYDVSKQYAGNRSFKYELIRNLLQNKAIPTGSGLMKYSTNKIDYVHWNDPNELVDRLRLLLASEYAGNNNHNNEIISILEELREANIII